MWNLVRHVVQQVTFDACFSSGVLGVRERESLPVITQCCPTSELRDRSWRARVGNIRGENHELLLMPAPKASVPSGGDSERRQAGPLGSESCPLNFGRANSWNVFRRRPHAAAAAMR